MLINKAKAAVHEITPKIIFHVFELAYFFTNTALTFTSKSGMTKVCLVPKLYSPIGVE